MSKPSCDLHASRPPAGPVFFHNIQLPGAPPPSPNGRVLYENLGIRIDRDGVSHYHDSPIGRKELLCLFPGAPTRDAGGRHRLHGDAESDGRHCLGLRSGGCLFPPGRLDEAS